MRRAKELGLVTILDSKRGDIASTASAYAEAAFSVWDADALTVNPYLGRDAVEPFIHAARQAQRGLFVLVRNSNPGSGLFQNLICDGRPLYQHVAAAVGEWNRENLGQCGLGDVGAVVGATHPSELRLLREMLPEVWFLVPGFGRKEARRRMLPRLFVRTASAPSSIVRAASCSRFIPTIHNGNKPSLRRLRMRSPPLREITP